VDCGDERVVLNNIINRLRCRFYLLCFSVFSRDVAVKSLVEKLRSTGFDFVQFEKALQYRPRKWKLFLQALIHRSYLQLTDKQWESNERLEFLGDSILGFVVAEHLFRTYPEMEEGDLTKLRSRLVNRKILAQRSKDLHISDFLLLSTSAAQSIDSGSESIIADAFESIIGALYLDGGFIAAKRFIYSSLLENPEVFNSAMMDDNYKSALLEYVQARSMGIPRYSVTQEEGPEHDRRFTVEVTVGTSSWGIGSGRSKKEAEQSAASAALEQIQQQKVNSNIERIHETTAK
jgi:ribonuclease III